jgi:hypothetical protein
MLPAREQQVGRHQHTKRRKRMMQCVGNQAVRRNDLGGLTVGRRMDGNRVFNGIKFALRLDGTAYLLIFINRDRLDPSHKPPND